MRVRSFLLLVIPLSIPTWSFAVAKDNLKITKKDANQTTVELDLSIPQITPVQIKGVTYNRLQLEDLPTTTLPGQAELPFKSIVLPVMDETIAVQVVEVVTKELKVGKLAPFQNLDFRTENGPDSTVLQVDDEYYRGNQLTPKQLFTLAKIGKFRDHTIYTLNVFPCRYNPVSETVVFYKKIVLAINYKPSSENVSTRNISLKEKQFLSRLTYPDLIREPPKWVRKQSQMLISNQPGQNSDTPQIKIFVAKDGLYQIGFEDLDTLDVDLSTVKPNNLKIYNRGKQIPIRVQGSEDGSFDPGDVIEFWGEFNKKTFLNVADDMYLDPFQDENVYWLSWDQGAGVRMIEEDGSVAETDPSKLISPFSYEFTVHEEVDRHFDRLSRVPPDLMRDHWFYDNGIDAGEKRDYAIFLPHPDIQADLRARIKVMMHGLTFTNVFDHDVTVFLNSRKVFDGTWNGQEKFAMETQPGQGVTPGVLEHGNNQLTIINNVASSKFDNVLLNWFEVTYQRLYKADEDQIMFGIQRSRGLGLYDFKIDGFSEPGIEVYKIGSSKIIGGEVRLVTDFEGQQSYQIHFQDDVFTEDTQYFAVTQSQKLKPQALVVDTPSNLRSPSNSADYLVIAPEVFLQSTALQELMNLRESQGLRTKLIWDQDIYDEFNDGIRSPMAIKKFLKYTLKSWQAPAPLYVLFAGDGSTDNKDILKNGGNLLPLYLFQANEFGATASDHWFSLLSGDDEISDVIVGRFPVRTEDQLNAVVQKTIQYELQSSLGQWRNSFLFIGGNRTDFREQSEALIRGSLPADYDPNRLYTLRDTSVPVDRYFGGTSTLINTFDQGVSLINYMGHGSGAIWSDNLLFRLEDVSRLNNRGRYPIITSMTCFAGAFDEPSRSSLSEVLLGTPEKGSVALWASSGLGWSFNDFFIVREFLRNFLSSETPQTLGEYIVRTNIDYFAKFFNTVFGQIVRSMINQYNILGDPALVAGLPRKKFKLEAKTKVPSAGDSLLVNGTGPLATGIAEVALLTGSRDIISNTETQVQNGQFEVKVKLPDNLQAEQVFIRAYVYNDVSKEEANGSIRLTLTGLATENLTTIPEAPSAKDSLRFSVNIHSQESIEAVYLHFLKPAREDSLAMAMVDPIGLWQTLEPIAPLAGAGDKIVFFIRARKESGEFYTSTVKVTQIAKGVDLRVLGGSIKLGGTEFVTLQATVENNGDAQTQNAEIAFFQKLQSDSTWTLIGMDSVSVNPADTASAHIPVHPGAGRASFLVKIDPEGRLDDSNLSDKQDSITVVVDKFNLDAALGSTLFGTANDTIHFQNSLSFYLPPNALASNSVLNIREIDNPKLSHQPDFSFVPTNGSVRSFELSNNDGRGDFEFAQPCWLALNFEPSDSSAAFVNEYGIYRWEDSTQKWVRQQSELESNNRLGTLITQLGSFAVIRARDTKPPQVEVKVEGQFLGQNSFVPRNPVITAIAQDENGIDISSDKIQILIDGQPFPQDQIVFPDSLLDANVYTMTISPNLTSGEHELVYRIFDTNGNASIPVELSVKIAEKADVRVLGTYPNPFKRKTVFAYELTQRADDLQLKIYTASGRMIRKFDVTNILEDPNPLSPDYHEITWDATDDFGDEVANGLYFYKLQARFDSDVVEQVGKIARIR
ncbi:MAG: C25 family cysteine peptidase [bacterium]